mgnify:CR=1 FL=1
MRNRSSLAWGFLFGIIFGFLLQKGGVTKFDVILGQLLLEDFTVIKIMLSGVGTGMIGIHLMKCLGGVQLNAISGSWGREASGGWGFGLGFGLLGYCPGTIAGAIGNVYLDALVGGLVGILLGSGLLAAAYPRLRGGILKKGDFGNLTLPRLLKVNDWIVVIPLSGQLILLLYLMERAGL